MIVSIFCILLSSFWFVRCRLLRYLRYFQQEEYSAARFFRWLSSNRAFDKKGSLIALSAALLSTLTASIFIAITASALLIAISLWEEDPRYRGKIRLKMTDRALGIFRVALALYFALSSALVWLVHSYGLPPVWIVQACLFQLTPAWLIAANLLLHSAEQRKQAQFIKEAHSKLHTVSPFIIGITGSYGKTSTKSALGQILQTSLGPTFWPSKGVNTAMGITREIRTHLHPGFRYAVIEMGAYGRGSIQKLCALTPPHAAIITCIGTAHYERFGSVDNIYLAKSELAQAISTDGILVCNGDDPGARRIASEYRKKTTLLYGFDPTQGPLDCWISSFKTTARGTQFTIKWSDKTYEGSSPLFGRPAILNAIGAFTMACTLGANPDFVLGVIRNIEPVDNRLQVHRDGLITYLRDAYNSNPIGFAAALDVMSALPGKRRIVVTPGIIELGERQEIENEQMGFLTGKASDLVIVVGKTNRKYLLNGLRRSGLREDQILLVDTRDIALKELSGLRRDEDVILIENDLSDLYEQISRF